MSPRGDALIEHVPSKVAPRCEDRHNNPLGHRCVVNPGAVAKNRALGYVADEVFDPCGHRLHDADFVEVAQGFGKVLPPEVRDYEMTEAEMPGVLTGGRQLANLDRSLEQVAMLGAGAGWNPDARDALTWMRFDDVSR